MMDDPAVLDLMDSEPAYSSESGGLFQGDSRESLKQLPDGCIDLVVTSPPFALQHKKEYGNEDQEGYNDWFMEFAEEVYRVLAPHGSFVIEIGGAFEKGWPKRSIYQFQLLTRLVEEGDFDLAQDFYWYNPAKLPNPIEWVNVRKIRVTDAVTHIWWLSKEVNKHSAVKDGERPQPEASNQRVLQEYSESHKNLLETGEYNDGKRGSGWDIDPESFANKNEGSIPDNLIEGHSARGVLDRWDEISALEFLELISDEDPEDLSAGDLLRTLGMGGPEPDNLIEASNTASNTHYLRMCREFGFDHHPARFPRQIPEFFISFLTPDPPYDDWDRGTLDRPIVLDIFAGSNLTGRVAESKGRYWLGFEQEEQYVQTSQFRFMDEDEIRNSLNDETSDFGEFAEVGND
jgi:site-specific DNA-methyltransferase (cytosine-N4-specific)